MLLGVVITAALPTAQNIFLHATRYRVGEDVARETILVTTLASRWHCSSPCCWADSPPDRPDRPRRTMDDLLDQLRTSIGADPC